MFYELRVEFVNPRNHFCRFRAGELRVKYNSVEFFLLHRRQGLLSARGHRAFPARASEQNTHVVAGQLFLPDDQYSLPLATGTHMNSSRIRALASPATIPES